MTARRKKPKVVSAFMARRRSDNHPALASVTHGAHSPMSILLFEYHRDARLLYGADYRIARVEVHEVKRKGEADMSDNTELERLRAFAVEVMGDWPEGGGVDSFDAQELAVKYGLLVEKLPPPTEPCGDDCWCAEYHGTDAAEWARGIRCYRWSPEMIEARRLVRR